MSSPFAGALMMTFSAPAAMCLSASSRFVNRPVDSSDPRAQLLPRQVRRVLLRQHPELVAVHDDAFPGGRDLAGEGPQDRVVLQQVGQRLRVGDVVHRDEVPVQSLLPGGPEEVPSDPPEPVDADLDAHEVPPGRERGFAFILANPG